LVIVLSEPTGWLEWFNFPLPSQLFFSRMLKVYFQYGDRVLHEYHSMGGTDWVVAGDGGGVVVFVCGGGSDVERELDAGLPKRFRGHVI
jgi:hypothetical protein